MACPRQTLVQNGAVLGKATGLNFNWIYVKYAILYKTRVMLISLFTMSLSQEQLIEYSKRIYELETLLNQQPPATEEWLYLRQTEFHLLLSDINRAITGNVIDIKSNQTNESLIQIMNNLDLSNNGFTNFYLQSLYRTFNTVSQRPLHLNPHIYPRQQVTATQLQQDQTNFQQTSLQNLTLSSQRGYETYDAYQQNSLGWNYGSGSGRRK
jgi:hypothetical protein